MRCWPIALVFVAGCSDAPDPDIHSPDPYARFLGALEKGDQGGTAETVKTLVQMLEDKDPLVRSGAVTALGGIGRPEFAQHVIPIAARKTEDRLVRSDAILVLGRLKNAEAIGPLLVILKGDDDMTLRRDAAKVLVVFGKRPEIVQGLLEALECTDPAVAYRAHLSLEELTGAKNVARTRAAWTEYLQKNP